MKAFKTILLMMVALVMFAFTSILNPDKTISEKVAEKEDLSTLLTALEAADLVEVLKGDGPFTVFAPVNQAFENLPEGKLDDLLKAENKEELAKILKYHVISGKILASDIKTEKMIESLEGTQLKLTVRSSGDEYMGDEAEAMNKVMVNNAVIIESDITVSNGVIHIIDGVVTPADMEVMGAKN